MTPVVLGLLAVVLGLMLLGVFSLLRDFVERNDNNEPSFGEAAGQRSDVKSQFAWQSQSHFRAPD
jgi:hypothetical protein